MSILAKNKRAYFDYQIVEKFEAGIILLGHEVKAVKSGQVNLSGAYLVWKKNNNKSELYLIKAKIALYRLAGRIEDYNPERDRKILLNKTEINYLLGKSQVSGLTLIPLKMYTKRGLVKLEFAIAKGKKKYDKREDIKKKEVERRLRTLTKKY